MVFAKKDTDPVAKNLTVDELWALIEELEDESMSGQREPALVSTLPKNEAV